MRKNIRNVMTSMEIGIWVLVVSVIFGFIGVILAFDFILVEQRETNRRLEYLASKLLDR